MAFIPKLTQRQLVSHKTQQVLDSHSYVIDLKKHDGYLLITTTQFADDTLFSVQNQLIEIAESVSK